MPSHYRLWGVLGFVAVGLLVFHVSGLRQDFSLEVLRHSFADHLVSGTLLFVLLFCLGNLAHVPGLVFMGAAVLALGRLWGGVVTFMAANAACLSTFLLIRLLGGDALLQLNNRLARRILARLHLRPVASIWALRLLFQTLPTLNMALALSGVRLRDYLLGTLLGLPLPIALYCVFFDYLVGRFGIGFHG